MATTTYVGDHPSSSNYVQANEFHELLHFYIFFSYILDVVEYLRWQSIQNPIQ